MKELFKTIEYRSAQSKRSITLEVGDLSTVRWNGKTLTVRRLHSAQGYCYCRLPPGAEYKGMLPVHRIVATAWCPNPEGKPFVDHIDSNRRNNQASNLRWVTRQENNSRLHSRRLKSQNHTATNRDDQLILMRKGKRIEIAVNGYACARMIGCSHVLVYNVLSPVHWAKTAKGWSLQWVKTIDALKQLISET